MQRLSGQRDAPLVGIVEALEQPQQRGLAASRGPHECNTLSGADGEGDVVEGGEGAAGGVGEGDVLEDDFGGGGGGWGGARALV